MRETVVLLHGFGGTRRAWDRVVQRLDAERYRPLALDLPGHGARALAQQPVTFAACTQLVLAEAPERFVLCGYSMGGRVALHVALAAPARVQHLVLVACDPGIEDERERLARRDADERLSRELEERAPREGAMEAFSEIWNAQPLFALDPPEVSALARADHMRNDPRALAAALRRLGAGSMQPLWTRLHELEPPVRFLAGDRDAKFTAIGRRVAATVRDGRLVSLSGGHRLLLEAPAGVARAIAQARAAPQAGTGASAASARAGSRSRVR